MRNVLVYHNPSFRRPHRLPLRWHFGFTLIELMIVVAIAAVLAMIAVPTYVDYIQKSFRVEAKQEMLALAQALERCYTQNNSYLGCAAAANVTTERYTISASPTTSAFTVTASPVSSQSADPCGTMTVNQSGQRTPTTPSSCWN